MNILGLLGLLPVRMLLRVLLHVFRQQCKWLAEGPLTADTLLLKCVCRAVVDTVSAAAAHLCDCCKLHDKQPGPVLSFHVPAVHSPVLS